MDNHTPMVGDIYLDENGYIMIITKIDTDGEHYMVYDDGSYDSVWGLSTYTYIGHYDIKQMFKAMEDAKANHLDIDTQVVRAIEYMNKRITDKDNNSRLIGCDMRVDKDNNTVFVQMYDTIGAGYRWVSVADLIEQFKLPK